MEVDSIYLDDGVLRHVPHGNLQASSSVFLLGGTDKIANLLACVQFLWSIGIFLSLIHIWLQEAPIRYIVDDCLKFVLREQRRGRQYDGIVMDPPSYGRGAGGQIWKVENDLYELVTEAAKLLSPSPLFFLISSYTTGLSSVVTANLLERTVRPRFGGAIAADNLCLPVEGSRLVLPCGTTARWSK